MTASLRGKTRTRGILRRRPLNPGTLQMMVQSGVVRRADFDPPSCESRTRFHALDDGDHDSMEEMASEQGWLAGFLLGRRSQRSVSKRS
jgi:hypothetical protein